MRYIILLLLNLPIILLALINFITKYKTSKITKERFKFQVALWVIILVILVASFPIYNILSGNHPLESSDLSFFDIIQTTAIIFLVYIANSQRKRIESADKRLRDLHQELSIKISSTDK